MDGSSSEYRFEHLFLPLGLLAEWLPADERGIDNFSLLPFVIINKRLSIYTIR